ncbi:MAG: hypothetical protein Q9183_005576 [Haloplaca sp. 2 TL-2023]
MLRMLFFAALLFVAHVTLAADAQDDDEFCREYATCRANGQRYWLALRNKLVEKSPMDRTDIMPDGSTRFDTYYGIRRAIKPFRPDKIGHELRYNGFDTKFILSWESVPRLSAHGPLDPHHGTGASAAYQNGFDTKNGLIVAYNNYRDADRQKQLPWSEIMYGSWKAIQAQAQQFGQRNGPISGLRVVVRMGIANPGTYGILLRIYTMRRIPVQERKWVKWTLEEQPSAFLALLGTDNVKGVIWLLSDHAAEIGKKTITAIRTRFGEYPSSVAPDIWIEIGPPKSVSQLRLGLSHTLLSRPGHAARSNLAGA